MNNVDIVVHAAATKIVPTAELNPYECVKTNISGAVNVAESAIACNVKKVVALSTDKACNPINLYGATKLASDKIFVAANPFGSKRKTRFSVVRYGNVMGSRGSVIPFFKTLLAGGADSFPITDVRMTRFMITLEQAVELVWLAASDMVGGEIYVKKIPSMKLTDIATAISDEVALKIVGIRPGEKVHEHMISPEDATNTFEYDSYYKIFPSIGATSDFDEIVGDGVRVMEGFSYASDTNDDWMTVMQLRKWLSTRYN
jgi:UDP-N-acetylglucosamine 4,6-dehydratase